MKNLFLMFWLGASLAACSSTATSSAPSAPAQPASAQSSSAGIVGTPAPGSKFSMIHLGMDKTEVQSIIGPPTDQSSHNTAKVYIPFYSGSDTTEIDAHYKGEGVLTYASRQVGDTSYVLTGITVNPQESGYIQ
jgi:hypothetical protein